MMRRVLRVMVMWIASVVSTGGICWTFWRALKAGYAEAIGIVCALWLALCVLYGLLELAKVLTDDGRQWPWERSETPSPEGKGK
jgi:hypothetical protein